MTLSTAPSTALNVVDDAAWRPYNVQLSSGVLTIRSPYDADLVASIKALPGRRWVRDDKVNTVPLTSAPDLLDLIAATDADWAFSREAADAVKQVLAGEDVDLALTGRVLDHQEIFGRFKLSFPYDADLVATVKRLPGRNWDGTTNIFPLSSYAELQAFVEERAAAGTPFHVTKSATEALATAAAKVEAQRAHQRVRQEQERTAEAQRAADAEQRRERGQVAEAQRVADAKAQALADAESAITRSKATTCSVDDVAAWLGLSELGGELRDFQRAGVDYALRAGGGAFIADEQGTGKTVQALAALAGAGSWPAVIVCPASVKLVWRDHVRGPAPHAPNGWLPNRRVAVLSGRKPSRDKLLVDGQVADVIVLNYDILSAWLPTLTKLWIKGAVFDESHYAKDGRSARTKAALALAESARANHGLVLNLTGTPVLNRPVELIAQLDLLGRLDEFGGFWPFAKRYCAATKTRYGWDMSGSSHREELHRLLRQRCMVRRLKADVLSELPAKQVVRVPLTIDNGAAYRRAERETVAWLRERAADRARKHAADAKLTPEERERRARAAGRKAADAASGNAEALVRLNALRLVAAQGKLAGAIEWVRDFLANADEGADGGKLVVFAGHREIQDGLLAAFSDQAPAHVFGGDDATTRAAEVERFQTDPGCRLIVCSMRAAREGITLTAASDVAFVELDWTPAAHDQAEDRIHRIGQEAQATCWYLLADETVDMWMHDLIEAKRDVVNAVVDGSQAPERTVSVAAELQKRLLAQAGPAPKARRQRGQAAAGAKDGAK